jgi:hypothetical protein
MNVREPLLVEVYLKGGHVSGLTRLVEERVRLVDLLNNPDSLFELESAKLTAGDSGVARFLPSLVIEKSAILVAIPHETQDQLRHRAMLNTGLGRTTKQAQISVLLPPLFVEGTAHFAPGTMRFRPSLNTFTHFFPLTSAVIHLPDGESVEQPVILVNRDGVAALSLPQESLASRLAS